MKKIANEIMLITYADSLGGDLQKLKRVLSEHFDGVVGGLHILPFYPSSGDRGFAVINYDSVDPAFGDWDDIRELAERYYLMVDFMVNHASIRSREFQDYMERCDESPYRDMFIHWNEFWPNGEPTEADMEKLYRDGRHGQLQPADGNVRQGQGEISGHHPVQRLPHLRAEQHHLRGRLR